jgi:hypothetical protein
MVAERKQLKKDENTKGHAPSTVTEMSTVVEEVDATGIIATDASLKTEGWSFVLCLVGESAEMFTWKL